MQCRPNLIRSYIRCFKCKPLDTSVIYKYNIKISVLKSTSFPTLFQIKETIFLSFK